MATQTRASRSRRKNRRRGVEPDPKPYTEVWIAAQLGIHRMSLRRYRRTQNGLPGGRPIPLSIRMELALLDEQANEYRAQSAKEVNADGG